MAEPILKNFRKAVPTSFRRTVRAGAAALSLAIAVNFTATTSISAQQLQATPIASQPNQVDVNTNCHDFRPGVLMADTKCEIMKGQALDDALAKKDDNLACLRRVKSLFDDGKISRESVLKFGKDRACDLLKTLG
jgi:hypothetical protein